MHKISLLPINDFVTVRDGGQILPALLAKNLRVLMSCGGNGICSTCHVRVRQGLDQLSSMEDKERRTLALVDGADTSSRLACQTQVRGDGVVLELPPGMYIETVDDLVGLLGERAPENILHPIRGRILIPKGKIITRTLLDQSRSLDGEVQRMKGGLLGLDETSSAASTATTNGFAATGRGMAPKTSKGTDPKFLPSSVRNAIPVASVMVSVSLPTISTPSRHSSDNGTPGLRLPKSVNDEVRSAQPARLAAGTAVLNRVDRPSDWDDRVRDAAVTDTGMRRASNQDSLAVVRASSPELWRTRGHLFMVADGMGGHAGGNVASKLACDNIPQNYHQLASLEPAEALLKAYQKADRLIHDHAAAEKECRGMGTTCSTLVLLPEGALIAHVGDSRVYRVRQGRIEQLSFDHSMAWELIRVGLVSPEKANNTIARNVITRSLGQDKNVEVDIEGPLPIETGDVFLICSDGLSGHIEDPEMGLFASLFDPEEAARYLIALANLRGGRDNVTVVLARVDHWSEPDNAYESLDSTSPARSKQIVGENSLPRRKALLPIQEHIYRKASCGISEELVGTLSDQMKKSIEIAKEEDWPVDWPSLTTHCRQAEDALSEGRLKDLAGKVGEIFVLLGTAQRVSTSRVQE